MSTNTTIWDSREIPLLQLGALYVIHKAPLHFDNENFFSKNITIPIGEIVMPINYFLNLNLNSNVILYKFLYKSMLIDSYVSKLALKYSSHLKKLS